MHQGNEDGAWDVTLYWPDFEKITEIRWKVDRRLRTFYLRICLESEIYA